MMNLRKGLIAGAAIMMAIESASTVALAEGTAEDPRPERIETREEREPRAVTDDGEALGEVDESEMPEMPSAEDLPANKTKKELPELNDELPELNEDLPPKAVKEDGEALEEGSEPDDLPEIEEADGGIEFDQAEKKDFRNLFNQFLEWLKNFKPEETESE